MKSSQVYKSQVNIWSHTFLSDYIHTLLHPQVNLHKYDPHWCLAWYKGVCGWQRRVGGAPTPSGPHAACHANLGGALTWVVLTREEAGGRNRASCHAFQSASGWQVKSASWSLKPGHGMPIFGQKPQDQSKTWFNNHVSYEDDDDSHNIWRSKFLFKIFFSPC